MPLNDETKRLTSDKNKKLLKQGKGVILNWRQANLDFNWPPSTYVTLKQLFYLHPYTCHVWFSQELKHDYFCPLYRLDLIVYLDSNYRTWSTLLIRVLIYWIEYLHEIRTLRYSNLINSIISNRFDEDI